LKNGKTIPAARLWPLALSVSVGCGLLGACGGGAAGSGLTFLATAKTIGYVSGNAQIGAPSKTLAQPLVVYVASASNAAVAGVPVTWTVTAGGGSVSAATTSTDAQGNASVTWTLGALAGLGANLATATIVGLSGSPVIFTATIAGGAADHLTITTQPSTLAQSGVVLAQQPVIQLQDVSGNPASQAGVVITAAIASGGGALGGTPTETTNASGTASFTNLSIAGAVGGRTISFVAAPLAGATSGTITVTPGASDHLTITTQPSTSAQSGVAFAQQPVIQLQDAAGNAVSQAGVVITAAIGSGGGTLGGTPTAITNANGTASYTNLSIGGAVGGRTLSFAAAPLTGATSSTISIILVPAWVQLSPSGGPPDGLDAAAMDPINNRLMVFAGLNATGGTNATWVLSNADGQGGSQQWTSVVPNGAAGAPPSRHGSSVAYDTTHNRLMIFGGCLGGCLPVGNDVWVLTNANGLGGTPTWTQLSPSGTAPAGRQAAAVTYDNANNRLIIFGGQTGGASSGSTYSDVWVLTNANGLGGTPAWVQLAPSGGPPPGQYAPTAVYDASSNSAVVFGGATKGTGVVANAVWRLSNANGLGSAPAWTNLVAEGAAGSPAARNRQVASYDATTNQMIVFGGCQASFCQSTDVWVLSSANGIGGTAAWTQLLPSGGAPTAVVVGALRASSLRLTIVGSQSTTGAAWVLTHANGQ
jgi:hypothetical protein